MGIAVTKGKHDCFILISEGEVLANVFTIPNNAEINSIMNEARSPITALPGIGSRIGAMSLAEIGGFSNCDSAILAYTGLTPSTYRSGQPYRPTA